MANIFAKNSISYQRRPLPATQAGPLVRAISAALAILVSAIGAPDDTSSLPTRSLLQCTGNPARPLMTQGPLSHLGGDRFDVCGTGTHPRDRVKPLAPETTHQRGMHIGGQYPKTVFGLGEQPFDLLVTVCDEAALECPAYGPAIEHVHGSLPDPAAAVGTEHERLAAFKATANALGSCTRPLIVGVQLGRAIGPGPLELAN